MAYKHIHLIAGIYQVSSRIAQNENEDLREKVEEFIRFVQEEMTSYEVDGYSRYHKDDDHGKSAVRNEMYATFYTDDYHTVAALSMSHRIPMFQIMPDFTA